jgi:hypothetical protein
MSSARSGNSAARDSMEFGNALPAARDERLCGAIGEIEIIDIDKEGDYLFAKTAASRKAEGTMIPAGSAISFECLP